MPMRTPRVFAAVPLALAALFGCQSIIGADFSGQHLAVCHAATFPPPPKIIGAGTGADMVFVTSKIDLGEYDRPDGAPGYETIGYSLDGMCNRDQACAPAAWTGAHLVKGIDGRDNGLGQLMHGQLAFFNQFVFRTEMLNANLKNGTDAPLIMFKVADYTSFSDDDDVKVTLYLASPQGEDGKNFVPRWDGTDEWPIAPLPGAVADAGSLGPATYVDDHAYVSNYTLTARFPPGAIIRFSNVAFMTNELVVTGQIDPATKTISHGVLSGRMEISEMFRHVPEVTQLLLSQTLCIGNPNYARIKTYFCSFADVRADAKKTGGECDGLSIGVGFDGAPAKLGKVIVPTPVPACPPATTTKNDTCQRPPP